MKLRLAQPGTLVDLSGIAELKGITQGGRRDRDRRDDAPRRGRRVRPSSKPRFRRSPRSPTASATGRCATWARSAARSPTTIRPPTIRRRCSALGATVHTNKRTIAADDFFKGMYETALAADEIITAVELPGAEEGGVREVPATRRRASRWSACSSRRPAGGVRVAVTGAAPRVFRAKALEDALGEELHRRCRQGGQDRCEGA